MQVQCGKVLHSTSQPSSLACKWKQRVPSLTFVCTFGAPLTDVSACTICTRPVCCVPVLPHLRGLRTGSALLVFNSSWWLLCSLLCWIAALLSCNMPSVLTLFLSNWNVTWQGRTWPSSFGCWVWSFAMLLTLLMALNFVWTLLLIN